MKFVDGNNEKTPYKCLRASQSAMIRLEYDSEQKKMKDSFIAVLPKNLIRKRR